MSGVFRSKYRDLDKHEQASINEIKDRAQALLDVILKAGGDQQHAALAKTNLEQSVMWAVKAITG